VKKCPPVINAVPGIAYDALIAKGSQEYSQANTAHNANILAQLQNRDIEKKFRLDPNINCYYENNRKFRADVSQVGICQNKIDLCLSDKTESLISYPIN
jgi:hypothetical protein